VSRSFKALCAVSLACAALAVANLPVLAANESAFLSGSVVAAGAPVAGAEVTVSGNDVTLRTTSDAHGRFSFPPLALGTYDVEASHGHLHAAVHVDLGTAGADLTLALVKLTALGHVLVTGSAPVHGSGNDVVLNSTAITRSPNNNSFAEMEVQLPAAARGANGVVHMNGDHGVIDYMLDGVPLPQELNRDIGGEINVNDLSFIDLVEGAYPAQYGMRFGSVFNMSTRAGTGPAGWDYQASAGSYADLQSTLGYHSPIGASGGFDVAFGGLATSRGLDPPDFASPHNDASSTNQFARFTLPTHGDDFTNITFIHSNATFQIPNDVRLGEPAWTDDNETQDDTFLAIQAHHAIDGTGTLTFGPAVKFSNIRDFGDAPGDFAFGEALNVGPPPFGNGGSATDCADAVTDPSVVFLPTTCAYSLNDTRTAIDYIAQADYTQGFGRHVVAAGGSYDLSRILKYYAVTLQPGNFLAPIYTPATPNAPYTVVDSAPNLGNTYESYVQDDWRMSPGFEADYGLRYDFFTIRSTPFAQGFAAFSPRLKLTRFIGQRSSIYAYVGRFFEPFSFENVSPYAAQLLNLPLQRSIAAFDLKPERDTDLEIGGHMPLGSGDLGLRVMQKNANDLIDDTQVGITELHQDINYVLGRISEESINFTDPTPQGRAYFSIAHVDSVNKGCETQLLAPCFGSPVDFTPADHEQRYSVATGLLVNNARGGWFSADAEYGSGLSSAICPPGTPGYCKQTPHTIFSVENGFALGPHTAFTVGIQNLLDDHYYVTILNAQGNHVAAPREFTAGIRFNPAE